MDSLPDELLLNIFLHVIQLVCPFPFTVDFEWYHEDSLPYSWIALLRVCRRWYAIAYGSPLFWRTIPLADGTASSITKTMAFFRKVFTLSGHAPLRIFSVDVGDSTQKDIFFVTLPHIQRAEWVKLIISGTSQSGGPLRPSHVECPDLRYLSMSSVRAKHRGFPADVPLVSPSGSLAFLELLDFTGYNYRSISPFFRTTIKHLTLSLTYGGPSVGELLDALQNMPLLELLFIGQVVICRRYDFEEKPMVTLPHLRSLTIHASPADIQDMLLHLRFPNTTRMVLEIDVTERSDNDFMSFLGALTSTCEGRRTLDGKPFPVLQASYWANGHFESDLLLFSSLPHIYTDIEEPDLVNRGWTPYSANCEDFDLCLRVIDPVGNGPHPLWPRCPSLKNIRILIVEQDSAMRWRDAFRHLEQVEWLVIMATSMDSPYYLNMLCQDMWNALTTQVAPGPGEAHAQLGDVGEVDVDGGHIRTESAPESITSESKFPAHPKLLLPRLRTLSLTSFWFRQNPRAVHSPRIIIESEDFLNGLVSTLQKRHAMGVQVERLVVRSAVNFFEDDVAAVTPYVEVVNWDQHVKPQSRW